MGENNEARALEVANRALTIAEMLDDRMSRHEEDCQEERRSAAKQRHDFRAEVALTLGTMKDGLTRELNDLKNGFASAMLSLGNKIDNLHAENRKSISAIEKSGNETKVSVLIAVVALLLTIAGATVTKALGWW